MPYSIDRYSSNLFDPSASFPLNIADNTINSTSTSLRLIGRGVTNYGEGFAESLVHLMENFAGVSAPTHPITGQLWWKQDPTNANAPQKLYVWNGSIWKAVSGASAESSAPNGPSIGDLWYDINNNTLNFWNGTSWHVVYTKAAESLPTNPGATAPANPLEGFLWYKTSNDVLHTYNGSTWEALMKTDPNTDSTDDTFISYQTINGNEVIIIKVDGTIMAIWSKVSIPNSSLWDGTSPAGKPNIKALYPNGLTPGLNFSNVSGNGFSGAANTVYGDWSLNAGSTFQATYADIAERYHADKSYEPGTVVKLGGVNEITETTSYGDTNVFGVVSTAPAFILNSAAGVQETHPAVALTGRVPVKVEGKVCKGDRLVSGSTPGTAEAMHGTSAYEASDVFATIGRALQDKDTDGIGLVEVAIGAK